MEINYRAITKEISVPYMEELEGESTVIETAM